jgi:hypothetical protein
MKRIAAIALGLLSLAAQAFAQPATSFAQLGAGQALRLGERISIRQERGTLTGVFHGVSSDFLTVEVEGVDRRIPETEVRSIQRGFGHSKLYGALIGAAAGIVVTSLAANSYGNNEGGRFCNACFVQWGAGIVPASAGIGVAVGAVIDRSHRKTVFVRKAP